VNKKKTYLLLCHVCGRPFRLKSDFLSVSSVHIRRRGVLRSYGLGTCNMADVHAGRPGTHSQDEIEASFWGGPSADLFALYTK